MLCGHRLFDSLVEKLNIIINTNILRIGYRN